MENKSRHLLTEYYTVPREFLNIHPTQQSGVGFKKVLDKQYVLQSQTFEAYGDQSLWGSSTGSSRSISIPVTVAREEFHPVSTLETSLALSPATTRFVYRASFISMLLLGSALMLVR